YTGAFGSRPPVFTTLPLKNPPLEMTSESVSMLPFTRPVAVISTLPVATIVPSYTPRMMASTVRTLALTTPFSPITSCLPTFSSPPTAHSMWMESAMSNFPSTLALSPTIVSKVISAADRRSSDADTGGVTTGGEAPERPSISASFPIATLPVWASGPDARPDRLDPRTKRRELVPVQAAFQAVGERENPSARGRAEDRGPAPGPGPVSGG